MHYKLNLIDDDEMMINYCIKSLIFDLFLSVIFLPFLLNMLSYHLTQSQVDPFLCLPQHRWQLFYSLKAQPKLIFYLPFAFVGQSHRHYDFIINIIHFLSKNVKGESTASIVPPREF